MSFERFQATGTAEVTLDVPEGYKILCGGVTLHGYALLTASYPESPTRWVCRAFPLHCDATVVVSVLALKDKDSLLDVTVTSQVAKGTSTVQVPAGSLAVGLCGGAHVQTTCLAASYSTAPGCWVASAESEQDIVTTYLLIGTMKDRERKVLVDSNRRGTWRIYIEGVGDAAIYLGAARGQNAVAQSTMFTPPNEFATKHPWKATPRVWRSTRSTLPLEERAKLTKTFCTVTTKSPRLHTEKSKGARDSLAETY